MLNTSKYLAKIITPMIVLAAGCGASGDVMVPSGEEPAPAKVEPLATPSVRLVSPPVWSAGQMVTVLGADFVEPSRGYTVLTFEGEFEANGRAAPVTMSVQGTYRSSGKLEFVFEPAMPPAGFGNEIGTFHGQLTAINTDDDSASPASRPLDAAVEVGPSLILWSVQPANRACADEPRVSTTLDGTKLVFDIEAIGLTDATAYTPLTITASYVSLVIDTVTELPKENVPMEVIKRLTNGRRVSMTLDLGRLPDGVVESAVQVNVKVQDGLGTELSRIVPITVGREHSISYDGNVRVVELYAPSLVTGCLPGGSYGSNFNYSEGTSESRSRSVGYNVNLGINIWVANIGFGFNVGDSVSSGTSDNLGVSGRVFPGQYGVFYRQTQRLERIGKIEQLDVCGAKRVVGEARVTDWNWAPDLAITTNGQCPPAPPSNLPPAQVYE